MANWIPYTHRVLFLDLPKYDPNRLPVPHRDQRLSISDRARRFFRSVAERKQDMQVVAEFRNKMRTAEDLIAKLAYNLREIQGARSGPTTPSRRPVSRRATVSNVLTALISTKKDY